MLLADSATELGECVVIGKLSMVVTFSCLARIFSNQRCPTKLFDAIAARIKNAPTSARVGLLDALGDLDSRGQDSVQLNDR